MFWTLCCVMVTFLTVLYLSSTGGPATNRGILLLQTINTVSADELDQMCWEQEKALMGSRAVHSSFVALKLIKHLRHPYNK